MKNKMQGKKREKKNEKKKKSTRDSEIKEIKKKYIKTAVYSNEIKEFEWGEQKVAKIACLRIFCITKMVFTFIFNAISFTFCGTYQWNLTFSFVSSLPYFFIFRKFSIFLSFLLYSVIRL